MRSLCIIPGGTLFSVNIDEKILVDELKEIKKAKAPELDTLAANALTLYQINVDGSDEREYIEQVKVLAQDLSTLNKLKPIDSLDKVFPWGPLERKIQILVEVPKGESINLCARVRPHTQRLVLSCQCLPWQAETLELREEQQLQTRPGSWPAVTCRRS